MKIFISYRRDDTRDLSALISDRLRRRYGEANVFLDSGSIKAGSKWRKQLTTELHTCDVLIAVIGDDWLDVRDDQGRRRIDNPEDEVRREIITAFDRDIPVIPLLVERTKMPGPESLPQPLRQLHERQWLEIRSDQYFDNDVKLLCNHVDALRKSNRRLRTAIAGSIAIVLVLVGTVIGLVFSSPSKTPPNPDGNPTGLTHPPSVPTPDPVGPQSDSKSAKRDAILKIQTELSRISTLVNQYTQGRQIDGLVVGGDIPPLTAVFEELHAKKDLIGNEAFQALRNEGRTLITLVNARGDDAAVKDGWATWKAQTDIVDGIVTSLSETPPNARVRQ